MWFSFPHLLLTPLLHYLNMTGSVFLLGSLLQLLIKSIILLISFYFCSLDFKRSFLSNWQLLSPLLIWICTFTTLPSTNNFGLYLYNCTFYRYVICLKFVSFLFHQVYPSYGCILESYVFSLNANMWASSGLGVDPSLLCSYDADIVWVVKFSTRL